MPFSRGSGDAPGLTGALKLLSLAFGVSIGVSIFLAGRWYLYVTNGATPHDEIGIALNGMMPHPLNAWACRRLRERFPQARPPDGCADPSGARRRGAGSGPS